MAVGIATATIFQCLLLSPPHVTYGFNNPPSSNNPTFVANRNDIIGIWKFSFPKKTTRLAPTTPPPPNRSPRELSKIKRGHDNTIPTVDVLLKINHDGSFVQCGACDDIFDDEDDDDDDGDGSADVKLPVRIPADGGPSLVLSRLKGLWNYQNERIVLATERTPGGSGIAATTDDDILLSGPVLVRRRQRDATSERQSPPNDNGNDDDDVAIITTVGIPHGTISAGKFIYARKHASFFDEPMMFQSEIVGEFRSTKVFGDDTMTSGGSSVSSSSSEPTDDGFHKRDFYGKRFYLTVRPLPEKTTRVARRRRRRPRRRWDGRRGTNNDDEDEGDNQMIDVSLMPIEFYSNNTFAAICSNKILRGRYGTTGDEKDRLWFQVSLFGAGRSAPGSVYSEGIGLTHDDQRSYRGTIREEPIIDNGSSSSGTGDGTDDDDVHEQTIQKQLFVEGTVTFGSDLGTDARPEPVGKFILREVGENEEGAQYYHDFDDDFDLDDFSDSIFE